MDKEDSVVVVRAAKSKLEVTVAITAMLVAADCNKNNRGHPGKGNQLFPSFAIRSSLKHWCPSVHSAREPS